MNSVMRRDEKTSLPLNVRVVGKDPVVENAIRKVSTRSARSRYQYLDEVALVIECQNGAPEAFDELVNRTNNCVIGMLRRFAPSNFDISDLSQEVHIRVWRKIGGLRNPRAFKRWLVRIVTNLVNDEYRKREHVHIVSIDEPVLINGNLEQNVTQVFKDPGPSPDEQIEQTELLKDIWDGIVQLREPFKAALVLRDVDDLSYDEVAQVMGIRLGTVKSRIARARKQLSEILGERVRDAA